MTRSETAILLGLMAGRDSRRVDETMVAAWHQDIGDIDFEDANQAVSIHYQESTDRIMPAHIRRLVTQIVRERHRLEREERERLALEATASAAVPTQDRRSDVADMLATLRDRLGPSDPNVLRRTEWVRTEKSRQRANDAGPNPHYQGPPPPNGWPVPDADTA